MLSQISLHSERFRDFFERVVFHEPGDGDPFLEPTIRPQVIGVYDEELRPIIRQLSLDLGGTALKRIPDVVVRAFSPLPALLHFRFGANDVS